MKLAYAPLAVALGALVLSGTAEAADYVIDNKGNHAAVGFRIKHLGFSWLSGRFDKFSGTFSFDKAKPEASKVKVEIDTTSLNSNHAERDKHLKSADFIDAGKFPKASFESTAVKPAGDGKATVVGNLTLHGVTKEIAIEAEQVGEGDDPWGGYRSGFTGTTTLKLADFGIDTAKLGPSAAEVLLTLDIEGVKQ
jgi:polyisoprenoid-binding protein YceI